MTRLVVVADDLTGALDTSAPFAARGFTTTVALGLAGLPAALASNADVVAVSTDSREVPADLARMVVSAAVAALPPGVLVFKKIDSRLKGNLAAELDALSFKNALVVPAIPAFGRWMRDGYLGGFGVAEPISVAKRLGHHAPNCVVPEISTQSDIDAALAIGEHDLLVGARGLAEALANQWNEAAPKFEPLPRKVPAYCVIGSVDPITSQQVGNLLAAHRTQKLGTPVANSNFAYLEAPNGVLAPKIKSGKKLTVLRATAGESAADSGAVAKGLGAGLQQLAPPTGSVLLISGGATAQIVLRTLGVETVELLGEALAGLPIARGGGFTIITKSGGFGEPDALVKLFAHLGPSAREHNG
jgi:uncharacterized protein YgbK (DUF1537 family)